MKRKQLKFGKGFKVAIDNRKAQAAEMVIAPGDFEGGPKTRIAARINGCPSFPAAPPRTLNVYVPRAYAKSGDELPAAKR